MASDEKVHVCEREGPWIQCYVMAFWFGNHMTDFILRFYNPQGAMPISVALRRIYSPWLTHTRRYVIHVHNGRRTTSGERFWRRRMRCCQYGESLQWPLNTRVVVGHNHLLNCQETNCTNWRTSLWNILIAWVVAAGLRR